jgi:8-oxo-dGTP diphosphatase
LETPVEFGEKIEGAIYRPRPGAYAVIRDSGGLVAVLRTPQGLFLPGGGIDEGEEITAALHREIREEIGYAIEIVRPLGFAIENIVSRSERHIAKHCHFFEANLLARVTDQHETDHVLVWLPVPQAVEDLREESQSWTVSKIVVP